MLKWVQGKIIKVQHWTDTIFSIILNAPIDSFIAGQFTKLKVEINGKKIQRAYSYVNSPLNKNIEFYISVIPNGKFSSFLHSLRTGDNLMIRKKSIGFFTLKNIPSCKNLWMFATGTAIGPYLSMLEEEIELKKFKKIFLIYATRFLKDMNYLPKILEFEKKYNGKLYLQKVFSQENTSDSITGHIPDLFLNGILEKSVREKINAYDSQIMLCGNPNMVRNMKKLLKEKRNMKEKNEFNNGNIISENYW